MTQIVATTAAEATSSTVQTHGAHPTKPKRDATSASKTDVVLKKLRGAKGVSVQQLADVTGWQPHSVRGFLSGTVRKKLGLTLVSDVGKDAVRRYRITDQAVSTPA